MGENAELLSLESENLAFLSISLPDIYCMAWGKLFHLSEL